jgi:hypothetical protein
VQKTLFLLLFFISTALCIPLASAQNHSMNSIPLVSGISASGEINDSSSDLTNYSISVPVGSELALTFEIEESDLPITWSAVVSRSSDNLMIAQYHLLASDLPQIRRMNVLETDEFLITIESIGQKPVTGKYRLTASIEQPSSQSLYDGIWKVGEEGYAAIYQQEDSMTILILGYSSNLGYKWEAQVGALNGSQVITNTVMGYVQLKMSFVFSSPEKASVTLIECTQLDSTNPCLFPNGTTIYMNRIDKIAN